MHWDAWLDDGKGELPFGRPIRWILFLYGGRVVPFDIRRTELAAGPLVQDVRSGPVTYGHRFLTTSGRAGRAVKVKTFDDYRARLLEHFVILEREERHDRIVARAGLPRAPRSAAACTASPARQAGPARGGAGPRRVPVGRRRHVHAGLPRPAGGSADDDDDPPPALLPGRATKPAG